MQCETCGKDVKVGLRVKLEGSVIFTCESCAKYGEVVAEVKTAPKAEKKPVFEQPRRPVFQPSGEEYVESLVENFHSVIKNAREKMGWKQEDLAKKLNEPMSMVHRLETEAHFEPSDELVRKLQKVLGVKLKESVKADGMGGLKSGSKNAKDLTLGDVVVVKKRK
jgi:putative transcription factor